MRRRKTGPDLATVELVRWRDRDTCRRCPRAGEQIHHRKPRGMGGTRDPRINCPSNLVLLCSADHLWVETHRAQARDEGWLVSQWQDPARVPIVVGGRPTWLAEDGKAYPEMRGARDVHGPRV